MLLRAYTHLTFISIDLEALEEDSYFRLVASFPIAVAITVLQETKIRRV